MSAPSGDPQAVRGMAATLRREAVALADALARTAAVMELPGNRGAAADRDREIAVGLRERAGGVANRLEALALELDRGAAWLDQAILDAQAYGQG